MNIEDLRTYCLSKPGVSESFPFDQSTLVFKVAGKIFCLTDLDGELSVNLKNDPQKNEMLRERYQAVKPGYHMNKQHWNTVEIDDTIPDDFIRQLIDESYGSVVKKLSLKQQKELK